MNLVRVIYTIRRVTFRLSMLVCGVVCVGGLVLRVP